MKQVHFCGLTKIYPNKLVTIFFIILKCIEKMCENLPFNPSHQSISETIFYLGQYLITIFFNLIGPLFIIIVLHSKLSNVHILLISKKTSTFSTLLEGLECDTCRAPFDTSRLEHARAFYQNTFHDIPNSKQVRYRYC